MEPTEKGHFSYFVLEADSAQKVRELFHPMQPEIRSLMKWSDMAKGV